MKGTVVKLWINTLKGMYGENDISDIIKSIGMDPTRAISPLENVEDSVVDKMIGAVAQNYNITKSKLWSMIGEDNIQEFFKWYPVFFNKANMFLFLCSLNTPSCQKKDIRLKSSYIGYRDSGQKRGYYDI